MRTTRRGFTQSYSLPDDVRGMLTRRLTELAGLALLVLSGCGAIALATWNVQDPSFNHATTGAVEQRVRVRGRLYLTPDEQGWRVFGFDVAKAAR